MLIQDYTYTANPEHIFNQMYKRYWLNDTYALGIELSEIPSGVEIKFYE